MPNAALPSIQESIDFVVSVLQSNRDTISRAIRSTGVDRDLGQVLGYYSANLDSGQFPVIMVAPTSEELGWEAMPVIGNEVHSLTIWGMVHWDDPGQRQAALTELARAVKQALNHRHQAFDLPSGGSLYFNEVTPVRRIEYGLSAYGNVFVGTFAASFSSSVCYQLADDRSTPTL